jgi:hypothetical protein
LEELHLEGSLEVGLVLPFYLHPPTSTLPSGPSYPPRKNQMKAAKSRNENIVDAIFRKVAFIRLETLFATNNRLRNRLLGRSLAELAGFSVSNARKFTVNRLKERTRKSQSQHRNLL